MTSLVRVRDLPVFGARCQPSVPDRAPTLTRGPVAHVSVVHYTSPTAANFPSLWLLCPCLRPLADVLVQPCSGRRLRGVLPLVCIHRGPHKNGPGWHDVVNAAEVCSLSVSKHCGVTAD